MLDALWLLAKLAFWAGWGLFVGYLTYDTMQIVRRKRRVTKNVQTYGDVISRCLATGKTIVGNRRPDGTWDIQELPDSHEPDRTDA